MQKKQETFREEELSKVLRLVRGRNTAQKVVLRAKIVLRMMEGLNKRSIAVQLVYCPIINWTL